MRRKVSAENGNDRSRQTADVRERVYGCLPAKRETTGGGVYDHQDEINDERRGQAASGKRQMRATVKDVSSERADDKFDYEKRNLAVREHARHERVAFGGEVQVNPEQRELRIEPVQGKQEQAFYKSTPGVTPLANRC